MFKMCPSCGGLGYISNKPCSKCKGSGAVNYEEDIIHVSKFPGFFFIIFLLILIAVIWWITK